jgi:hypothetical protein
MIVIVAEALFTVSVLGFAQFRTAFRRNFR